MRRERISSELIMFVGGVHSILLLPRVARCLETIDVCIWLMFVFMYVVVIVCYVATVVKESVFQPWSVEVCCMFV